MIEIQVHRMRIGLKYCRQARVKGIDHLNYCEILVCIIMSALLIGDIKTNPGTRLNESSNSSSANGIFEKSSIKSKFSVVHYNIQNLSNKILT